jgi:hypothetical protein
MIASRSVLAVLDQFSRMRAQFSGLFSAFAVIRLIRWIRNKIRQLSGVPDQVAAWGMNIPAQCYDHYFWQY